tara:strand:+ start:13 stop:201 length:189 start_codon:yes stop_codon:yes gene_type:complete
MTQDKAKQIYFDIKQRIEDCINESQLSVLIADVESRRLNKLLKEYPILHNRIMSLINNKRRQ